MDDRYRQQIAQYVTDFHLPRYRELPDFGLRLEQVVRYVNRYLPTPLTGSMVSNYVKQKTIPGPVKKTYGAESIGYLIFVSYMKTVASMEDIRFMMGIQRSSYDLMVAYDYFCGEFENLLQYVSGLKAEPDEIGHQHTAQKELLRTALMSITYKVYLDQCFRLLRAENEQQSEEKIEQPHR